MNYSLTKFAKSVTSQRAFPLNASVVTKCDRSLMQAGEKQKSNTAPATYAVLLLYDLENEEDRSIIAESKTLSNTVL